MMIPLLINIVTKKKGTHINVYYYFYNYHYHKYFIVRLYRAK